ncbi:hypothetical protein ACFL2K_04410 [Candidatus Margulisiibacteriota bacterium]
MSLTNIQLSFLSIKPVVIVNNRFIIIKKSFFQKLFGLFLKNYKTEIDFLLNRITHTETSYFFFNKKVIRSFKKLSHIDYSKKDFATSWGACHTNSGMSSMDFDSVSIFHVYLFFKDNSQIKLGSYFGEGARNTGWLGVLLGDSIIDFSGNQREKSHSLVLLLSKRLKIPIGRQLDLSHLETKCPYCKHIIGKKSKKCLYCGKFQNG